MQRWCQKLFCASWPLILCIQSAIRCHDSNFKFWRRRDCLHVLRLWSPCFMHCSNVNYTPPNGKHDVGGGNNGCQTFGAVQTGPTYYTRMMIDLCADASFSKPFCALPSWITNIYRNNSVTGMTWAQHILQTFVTLIQAKYHRVISEWHASIVGINGRRRNHTIDAGGWENLDVAVSECVIRWASCTTFSTRSTTF